MRTIKFKVWSMGMSRPLTIYEMTKSDGDISYYDDDTIFLQFTGLKDKNGKEIYEGDIIWNSGGLKYEVLYSYGDCGFVCRDAKGRYVGNPHVFENREIIGNIYENPDLLK